MIEKLLSSEKNFCVYQCEFNFVVVVQLHEYVLFVDFKYHLFGLYPFFKGITKLQFTLRFGDLM